MPSGFHSLTPLYGAGLWDAVITAPQPYSVVPRARVGVETIPASVASPPAERTPAHSDAASMDPVVRGSRPTITVPYSSPSVLPMARARSGVTSTFASPRIPEEPKRATRGNGARVEIPSRVPRGRRRSAANDYIATTGCVATRRGGPEASGLRIRWLHEDHEAAAVGRPSSRGRGARRAAVRTDLPVRQQGCAAPRARWRDGHRTRRALAR